MPDVIKNKPVKVTEHRVGTIYRQTYQEGKRVQTYDVEVKNYVNLPNEKELKTAFTISNMFEIATTYQLKKMEKDTTYFNYITTNYPLKWYVKPFLNVRKV